MHRVDALISQKMTASPYTLDIYGHCGLTGIYEHAVTNLEQEAGRNKHTTTTTTISDAASQVASALLAIKKFPKSCQKVAKKFPEKFMFITPI